MKKRILTGLLFFLLLGMLFSHIVQSLAFAGIVLLSLLEFTRTETSTRVRFKLWNFTSNESFWPYLFTVLMLLYVLVPFPVPEDINYWLSRMRIKAPFLLIPLAYYHLPKLDKEQLSNLIKLIQVLLSLVCLYVLYRYFIDFKSNVELIQVGKSVYTPGNHIKFSIILAFASLTGAYELTFRNSELSTKDRLLLTVGTLLLITTIHLIAVRTGMLTLYVGLATLLLSSIIIQKKYKAGISGLLMMILLPFLLYKISPAFEQKVNYMMYDLQKYKSGEGGLYSDSGRIVSFKVGIDNWKQNKIFGVGAGNAVIRTDAIFKEKYPDFEIVLMPHNQFVWVLMSGGIVGLSLFLLGLLGSLLYGRRRRNPYNIMLAVGFFVWLMFDHPFEGTVGVGVFFLFWMIAETMQSESQEIQISS